MVWLALLIGASGLVGGYATEQAVIPKLQHRPGTPIEVVQTCREAFVSAARTHASQMGAELIRVDATSAGQIRRTRNGQSAPVEVGIVYSRAGGRESRQGVVACHLDRRGRVTIADFAGAAR
jgi:hypothetical protein